MHKVVYIPTTVFYCIKGRKNDELVDSTTLGYQGGEVIKELLVVCVCLGQPTTTT